MNKGTRRCPRCQEEMRSVRTETGGGSKRRIRCIKCGFVFSSETKAPPIDDVIGRPTNLSPEQREVARRLIASVDLSHVTW